MESKDMSGGLFKNDKKKTDNHPDYNGNIVINNTKYYLSCWVNESKKGLTYWKLSASEEQKKQEPKTDSDVPF